MRSQIFYLFLFLYPIGSMYGTFTYIYHKHQPNVGKYTSPMDPMRYWFWTVDQNCTALALMILMDKIHRGWINGWKIHTYSRLESTYVESPPLSNFSKTVRMAFGGHQQLGEPRYWYDMQQKLPRSWLQSNLISLWGFLQVTNIPKPKEYTFWWQKNWMLFAQVLIMSFQIISLHRDGHIQSNKSDRSCDVIQHVASENPFHFSDFLSDDSTLWANYTKVTWLKNLVHVVRDSDIRTF